MVRIEKPSHFGFNLTGRVEVCLIYSQGAFLWVKHDNYYVFEIQIINHNFEINFIWRCTIINVKKQQSHCPEVLMAANIVG